MAKIYQFPSQGIMPEYATEEYIDAFIDDAFRTYWEEEEQYFVYQVEKRESCFSRILSKIFA